MARPVVAVIACCLHSMTKERERGEVLVVLDDDWMAALLRGHLSHAGFRVHQAGEAREGYRLARTVTPDCIVVNDELPDIDGFWVIDRVRRDPGPVSTVPVLLLAKNVDDVRGAEVGADLLLKKPLDNEEVVAQVGALLELAKRLRGKRTQRDSFVPQESGRTAALRGDLAQMSVTTILTVLEMERRTGTLSVEGASKGQQLQSAELGLSQGAVVHAQLRGKNVPAIDVLRHMLRLERGKFWFAPTDDKPSSGPAESLGMLMLEAARLEDEGR
jgi:two-component system OmpR family response regulator